MEREVIGFLLNKNPLIKFAEIIEKEGDKKIGLLTIDDKRYKSCVGRHC